MDNLLIYLFKVSAATTLLYFSYLLFFHKDTFYLRNRILLILTLVLPTLFPALRIPITYNEMPAEPVSAMDSFIFPESAFNTTMAGSVDLRPFDINRYLLLLYFVIAGLLLVRIAISLISTYRILKKGTVKDRKFPRIIITDKQLPPFSFFPYAVIPTNDYNSGNYSDILEHEFAHIRQGHTFDLLLSELFIAFQWFNPFIWLIKRSIVLNHEYLADHASLSKNRSIKDYQYRLLNFQPGLKHTSLAHNFNSLIKNRIIMINKKPSRRYATLKNILILPVVAFVVYAFATPEYHYVTPENTASGDLTIFESPVIFQKEVKGIVLNEEGKPLEGVNIMSTGTMGNASMGTTGADGRFSISNVQDDASLMFSCRGYKWLTIKPVFTSEMTVKMERDPEYKAPEGDNPNVSAVQRPSPLVVIDGVVSEKSYSEARKDLGYDMGTTIMIRGKEATDKYGEKAADGVYEITTRKKAIAMGLRPPFPRLAPEDYPTFQNQRYTEFSDWVVSQAKYPAAARAKNLEGWVSVNFTVGLNGSLSNVKSTLMIDPILSNEIISVIQSSPKWDPPKNPEVDEPFTYGVTLKFTLPDKITSEAPFVVVEQMPQYPGGDEALLEFIKNNTRYPETAKAEKISGRVIVRFVVSKEGNAEGISVLKGVDPLLDAEAIRVVSMLSGWKPGMQGGKAVDVWFMVPVSFNLSAEEPIFSKTSEIEILKFIGQNTGYPQAAKNSADTGMIYVNVRMDKGGIIKECSAFTDKNEIKFPILPDVVIVGYNNSTGLQGMANIKKEPSDEHPLLKTECLRIANKLGELDIPEWKENDMEFALAIKFVLK